MANKTFRFSVTIHVHDECECEIDSATVQDLIEDGFYSHIENEPEEELGGLHLTCELIEESDAEDDV